MSEAKNQGEGNREAARRYDEAQHKFVEAGKVDEAPRRAAPKSAPEARAPQQAQEQGKPPAKGQAPTRPGPHGADSRPKPAVTRTVPKSASPGRSGSARVLRSKDWRIWWTSSRSKNVPSAVVAISARAHAAAKRAWVALKR